MAEADGHKVLLRNKKARHEYFVEQTFEAGIELRGSEVKSLRDAAASLSDAYALVRDGQMYLVQMQINEYPFANRYNHDPKRDRRLLLHKREIAELGSAVQEKGYTLLPLELYLKQGRVKVLLGLCKGKQLHDKRQTERERTAKREIDRELGRR
ncbi:MAG TPA: SsrA-binding protein SmpB [Polyangiaceae bacterium]|nr:SsrA-binding protein SmpB [Polyangiaceae bacterium]